MKCSLVLGVGLAMVVGLAGPLRLSASAEIRRRSTSRTGPQRGGPFT